MMKTHQALRFIEYIYLNKNFFFILISNLTQNLQKKIFKKMSELEFKHFFDI